MQINTATIRTNSRISVGLCIFVVLAVTGGCVSVPPQVATIHQKELEILQSLEKAHLAMVDSFIDQKIQNFEDFFFQEYGPVFLEHWMGAFQTLNGRPYDAAKDFPTLYNDLVAEYQAESAPIEEARRQLHIAIAAEYRNAISAHKAVAAWINNLEKLNAAQRQAIDDLLGSLKPGLSLDSIDNDIKTAKESVERRISGLQ